MLYYHIDRNNELKQGQTLALMEARFCLCGPMLTYAEDHLNGLVSLHGQKYLNYMYGQKETYNRGLLCSAFIERDFEIVRLKYYPDQMSRLQCLFAATDLSHLLNDWQGLLSNDIVIWEIEAGKADIRDASFLVSTSQDTAFQFTEDCLAFEGICKYWEGTFSPTPQLECLVHLPAIVNRRL